MIGEKSNMLDKALQQKFDRDGYVLLKSLISRKKARKIRDKVIDLAETEERLAQGYIYQFDKTGNTQRVWNLINKGDIFRNLLEINLIDDFMNYIFDRKTEHQKYFLSSYQANILYPGSERQKLHIDTPVPEPLPQWPIKANIIWFLDDFTEENGATEFIPGSHKSLYKPTLEDDDKCEAIKACAPAGSVLITHGALWHRAGANKSNNSRIGLLCSMAASYALEIAHEEDHSLVINKNVIEDCSDHLKKIIGVGHGIKEGALVQHQG